jgi:hypothetical protein
VFDELFEWCRLQKTLRILKEAMMNALKAMKRALKTLRILERTLMNALESKVH